MKTTVEIPDSLFNEAKACAESRDIPFRQLVEEGLRAVIQREKHSRRRFTLRDASFGPGAAQTAEPSWPEIRRAIYEGRGE